MKDTKKTVVYDEICLNIQGEHFMLIGDESGWQWDHNEDALGMGCLKQKLGFKDAGEALNDAMAYVKELIATREDEREQEMQDKRYGTYEEQVRSYYYSTRL